MKDKASHAQERLYPLVPSPPLPTTLPLAEYAGRYTHPVYPAFTISLSSDSEPYLTAYSNDMMETKLKLTHVSGDFFTAELRVFHYARDPSAICRVEFRVDVKGAPTFGIDLEFDFDDGQEMVWFERSNDGGESGSPVSA